MGQSFFDKIFNTGNQNQPVFSNAGNSVDPIKAQVVINTISDGIAIIDDQGAIQLFNPAAEALTGWKATDAVALNFNSIFKLYNNAGREVDVSDNPIAAAFSTGKQAESDRCYIETISQKRIQILLKVTPIVVPDEQNAGKPTISGLVIVFRDITRERAEQNAQTDFISTASHEMRTPVATTEGYLGMILNPNICTIDDKARDYANKAHDAIKRLGRLFQDLLDVTKADDNRIPFRPVLIDAVAATRDVVNEFTELANQKGLSLIFEQDTTRDTGKTLTITPPSIIYVDLDHFNEVLSNMVENAIKYTMEGGVIVRVVNEDNRSRIEVADTGVGIPAEDLPHLFQKFYRVDNRETREIGGTGLGLYLIKKLTTSMGGTVGVSSDYGHGSTFWIEFDNLTRDQALQKAREIKANESARTDSSQL